MIKDETKMTCQNALVRILLVLMLVMYGWFAVVWIGSVCGSVLHCAHVGMCSICHVCVHIGLCCTCVHYMGLHCAYKCIHTCVCAAGVCTYVFVLHMCVHICFCAAGVCTYVFVPLVCARMCLCRWCVHMCCPCIHLLMDYLITVWWYCFSLHLITYNDICK